MSLAPFAAFEPLVAAPRAPAFPRWALFLDLDGTLLDIAPTPDAVIVPPGLVALLGDLSARLGGALALVSGRSLATLDALLAPARLAGVGQHGSEIRTHPAQPPRVLADVAAIAEASARLTALSASLPGTFVEPKGLSTAIHFRQVPEAEPAIRAALPRIVGGLESRIEAKPSKMAFDLKTRGLSKGSGITALLEATPFAGRVPVMVGDDLTDEDGFQAASAHGGVGVLVGPSDAIAARGGTAASYRIDRPQAVRDWLAALVA